MQQLFNLVMPPTEMTWLIPVVGGAVGGLAFLLGRRLFRASSPFPAAPDEPSLAVSLDGVSRDRRIAPRRGGNPIEVQVQQAADQPPLRAWVHDRSIGGLGLLSELPLPPGLFLKVRPKDAPSTTPWTDISVRSCRPLDEPGDNRYEIGCQFVGTPNWNQLLHFG